MVRVFLTISFLFTSLCPVWADESVTTDADLCTDILTKSLENMLTDNTIDHDRPIQLRYGDGYPLTNRTRNGIEVLFTSLGFSISNSFNKSGYICEIAVTDCSIIFRDIDFSIPSYRYAECSSEIYRFKRHPSFCIGGGNVKLLPILSFQKKMFKKTDNGYMFSRETKRVFITNNRSQLKILSLTAVIAILAYFASQ